jgi:hypothetical protein
VKRAEFATLEQGHIVLYRQRGRLIAHRIEMIAQDHLIARGDAILSSDSPVMPSDIVGSVVRILRNGTAVSPDPSPLSRIVAHLFDHSDLLMRLILYPIRHSGHHPAKS